MPVLLRRLVPAIDEQSAAIVQRPFRQASGSLKRQGGIEAAVNAVAELHPGHSILILLDCDDDCPAQLGPSLLRRVKIARPDLTISLVLAHREYESWFLATADTLGGRRSLQAELLPPANPESIRNAKGWLADRTKPPGRYRPTQDQAALSHLLDLDLARQRSRSFRKLWKEVESMVHAALDH